LIRGLLRWWAVTWRAVEGQVRDLATPRFRLAVSEGEFPARLKKRVLYVLTEDGTPWQASLICPCGCKATLELNLLPDERPLWSVKHAPRGPTVHPSVWRQVGCRSHFFIRDGRVFWAKG